MGTVAFTGHRPSKLGGYGDNPIRQRVIEALTDAVERAIGKGYTTFISGGAIGVDQWGAAIVLDARKTNPDIKLIVVRPFPGQESRWPVAVQEWYLKMLQHADEVITVASEYSVSVLFDRNKVMVDMADAVVAVYDGGSGGTAHCVRYALSVGKPVLVITPKTGRSGWLSDRPDYGYDGLPLI